MAWCSMGRSICAVVGGVRDVSGVEPAAKERPLDSGEGSVVLLDDEGRGRKKWTKPDG